MIRRFVNDVATINARRWFDAAGQAPVDLALRDLYRSIAQDVELRAPVCTASGRCCRFEEYGHRLYVTGLEAAWCLRQVPGPLTVRDVDRAQAAGTCPFIADNLCTVHTIKPMGCRVYFCDPTARDWQRELYERCHARLIEMHTQFAIPYQYSEWRTLLRLCVPLMPEYRVVNWRSMWGEQVEPDAPAGSGVPAAEPAPLPIVLPVASTGSDAAPESIAPNRLLHLPIL